MNETDLNDELNRLDAWDQAHDAGVYALAVDVPDSLPATRERWLSVHDLPPGDEILPRLSRAATVAYVGASGDMYERLCDHVAGDVRQSALLEAFDPQSIIGVWPTEDPVEADEYNTARRLGNRMGTIAWRDGEVHG